jgi:hypothetical protein
MVRINADDLPGLMRGQSQIDDNYEVPKQR